MLLASSRSFDAFEPFDDGLDPPLRNVFKGLESAGDFGAVRGEKPEGGLAVRITGVGAASSSKESSSINCRKDGCSYAP